MADVTFEVRGIPELLGKIAAVQRRLNGVTQNMPQQAAQEGLKVLRGALPRRTGATYASAAARVALGGAELRVGGAAIFLEGGVRREFGYRIRPRRYFWHAIQALRTYAGAQVSTAEREIKGLWG